MFMKSIHIIILNPFIIWVQYKFTTSKKIIHNHSNHNMYHLNLIKQLLKLPMFTQTNKQNKHFLTTPYLILTLLMVFRYFTKFIIIPSPHTTSNHNTNLLDSIHGHDFSMQTLKQQSKYFLQYVIMNKTWI